MECDTVFCQIAGGLFRVPFKVHVLG
jgi:hypothetical protein